MTLIRTAKKIIPIKMCVPQFRETCIPNKIFSQDVIVFSYVHKKNKAFVLRLSTHTSGEVEESQVAKQTIL